MIAYCRVYALLSPNKKISPLAVTRSFIIIVFQIPYRMASILKLLILSEHDIQTTLDLKKQKLYNQIKGLNVEFLNHKILLNCPTKNEMLHQFKLLHPNMNLAEYREILINFLSHSTEADKSTTYVEGMNNTATFNTSVITTEEGVKVPHRHLAAIRILYGSKRLIHATSNTDIVLTPSQIKANYIQSLIKPGSAKPGSIITSGQYTQRIEKISRIKVVPL